MNPVQNRDKKFNQKWNEMMFGIWSTIDSRRAKKTTLNTAVGRTVKLK